MHNQRSASMVGPGCFSADGAVDRDSASPSPLSPPPTESPLLLELRKNWTAAHKVVFKDLPRLAKRTSVQTEQHGVVIEAGRIVRSLHRPPAAASAAASSASSASASPPAAAASASSSSSSSPAAPVIPTGLNVRAASISFSRGAAPNDPSPSPSAASSSSYTPLANPAPGTSPLPNRRGTTGGVEGWKGTMVVRKHNKKVWQEKWESNRDGAQPAGAEATPASSPTPLPMSPGATAAANSGVSPKTPLSVVAPSPKHHGAAPSQDFKQQQHHPASSPSAKSAAAVALPSSPNAAASSSSASSSSSAAAPSAPKDDDKSAAVARSQLRSHSMIVSPSAAAAAGLSAPFQDLSLSSGEVDTWQAVCNVVLTCIELLEPTETLAAARTAFALAASSMGPGADHQGLLEDLFTKTIGLQSKTYRIFQAIHQSILFPAIAFLHEHLYSKMQTPNMKDVRRGDGWTILIYMGPAIYITHQRWEQNLVPESDPRHFEVRWEMRLSFDRQMLQLRAVILRIQELNFHEDSTPAFRQQIKDVLAGSGYIV